MRLKVPVIFILALLSLLWVSNAFAADATFASIWTTDASNNPTIEFGLGDTVYIHYVIEPGKTADISAWLGGTQDGSTWTGVSGSGVIDSYVPSLGVGIYTVKCTGANDLLIAYGTLLVIPELPFGTVIAAVAGLGSFGVLRLKYTKYKDR